MLEHAKNKADMMYNTNGCILCIADLINGGKHAHICLYLCVNAKKMLTLGEN